MDVSHTHCTNRLPNHLQQTQKRARALKRTHKP
jgi:hypothetical protein